MLLGPGSKVKCFREHTIQVLRVVGVCWAYVLNNSGTSCNRSIIVYSGIVYLEYLWLMYCGILQVLAVFRGSVQQILPDTQYIGVRYRGYSLYFKNFQRIAGLCTAGTARTGRISSVGTAKSRSTLNIRSNTRSMEYNSTICAQFR